MKSSLAMFRDLRPAALARLSVFRSVLLFLLPVVAPAQDTFVAVASSESRAISQLIRATGSVTSPQAALLSVSVGGLIERYLVEVGDAVAAGERLVQLDAELARFELEAAVAREAEATIALQNARRLLKEAEQLGGDEGVIAATEIENRRAAAIGQESTLAAASAEVRRAEAVLARHTIAAPFAGVVSERPAEVGEWVNTGDPLLRLVATDDVWFDFRLPQSVYASVSPDAEVTLVLDSLGDREFAGRVAAIVPVGDPTDRTFLLRVTAAAADAPQRIMPGMSARLQLLVDAGRSGVVVPRDAVLRYPDGRTAVWVVEQQDGRLVARERIVVLGNEADGAVEVRTGLPAGVRVVVRGNEALRDGQTVVLSR